jgi:UDP-N-acetylglucosamine--N-acetylmuramyl-(pentapeptide) pyrophosphoryl-undecaprenol N-acetylglucosamine transferase
MNKNETIVLTGGGTAGHVMVNINLENELKKHFNKIVYIGSENGIEKELVKNKTSFEYHSIKCVRFERKKILKALAIPFKLSKSVSEAKKLLKEINPSVIFSKGGYVGLPVVIAGKKLNIPVVCHESDISMGISNKIAKNYANKICTAFEKTSIDNGKKCIYTGIPLKLSKLSKTDAKEKLNIKTKKPVLLITGGSLGAQHINNFIFDNINDLTKNFYVIHLVGKGNLNKNIKSNDYTQIEFENDMWTLYKATDYAISRAGANTIIELLSNNILTTFIPLPKNVSRGDQVDNSVYLKSKGLADYISQNELSLEKLQNSLNFLKKHSINIKNNIKIAKIEDGTQNIINIIMQEKNTPS